MAGSRLEKIGTVFSRVRDLMRSGVMHPKNKPLWFDVYQAFPPKREPTFVKPYTRYGLKTKDPVPEIFYSEDTIRAKFHQRYGPGPRALELSNSSFVSVSQRFVEKYLELQQSHGDLDEEALFEETGKALLDQGITLRRRGSPPVSAGSKDRVLTRKLSDLLPEAQSEESNPEEILDSETQTHTDPSEPSGSNPTP